MADDDGGEEDEDDSEEDALQRCAFKRLEAASPQCKANCTSTGPCFLKFVLLYVANVVCVNGGAVGNISPINEIHTGQNPARHLTLRGAAARVALTF